MTFTPEVYERIRQGCKDSAARVVPRIIEMFRPQSVIDVGGGEGWWAKEFADRHINALCIDPTTETHAGDRLVRMRADFLTAFNDAIHTFDLALCLEVAEHLPARDADRLVELLTQVAPVVVFSAAIPGQGGHGHINEQWPDWWAGWFAEYGYVCSDDLRWWFWEDQQVEPWYRQNLLIFARPETFKLYGSMDMTGVSPQSVVHPEIFKWYRQT